MRKSKNQSSLNVPLLIVSAIVAALAWVGIYFLLYEPLSRHTVMPFAIGTTFTALFIVVALTVILVSSLMLTYRANVVTGKQEKLKVMLYLVVGTLVFFLVSAVLQFVYQSNILPNTAPANDYVFIIDDSGSMEDSDPTDSRFSVIPELLQEQPKHARYMVYSFADNTQLLRPMDTAKAGLPSVQGKSLGMTYILDALEHVIDDCDKGVWENRGNTTVIMVTDGYASDIDELQDVTPVLNRYVSAGITINAVGFGNVDTVLMTHIAQTTGGTSVDITDVAQLRSAVEAAVDNGYVDRNLISQRNVQSYNLVYGILRVLFVGILGTLVGWMAAMCYGNSFSFTLIITSSIIKSLVAGLVLELGLNVLDFPQSFVSLIAAILIGTVIATYGHPGREKSEPGSKNRLSSKGAPVDDEDFW